MKTERIGSDITRVGTQLVEPGMVYVLRGQFGGGDFVTETLHVVSRYAGGEIRGYSRRKGAAAWKLRYPVHPVEWPELDQAVREATGETIETRKEG